MSTKTTFKRIALVAVAALGFGVLSVVPSQATISGLTVSTGGTATSAQGASDTRTAATFTVSAFLDNVSDTITVQVIESGARPTAVTDYVLGTPRWGLLETATSTNGLINKTALDNTGTLLSSYVIGDSVTVGTATPYKIFSATADKFVGAKFYLQLDSITAVTPGAYNYQIITKTYNHNGSTQSISTTTTPITVTVAALAVAATPIPAAGSAKAYLQTQTGSSAPTFTGVLADSATTGSHVAGTVIGQIQVSNFTSADAVASDTITVKMTGVGYLITKTGTTTTGREFTVLNEDVLLMDVVADGSSGTGTITITTEKGASFVKTVTFYDQKPSKAVATVAKAYIKAGTGSVADVFSVVVTDAAGTAVTNAVVSAAVTDTATTVGGAASCGTYNTTDKVYYCAVAGLSTTKFGPVAYTIKAKGLDAAATTVSTSATTTFADSVATKATLTGAASAAPGASVEYTLTLTEKNGYPVADQVYGAGITGGVLFASVVASGWGTAPFATTDTFTSKSGVMTSKGIMPLAGTATGTWTLVGDGLQTLAANAIDKTIGKTTLVATTEVANAAADAATQAAEEAAAAAQDATDAALDATTAAEAAGALAQEAVDAVAELSAQVTTLIAALKKQITTLTNLVI